MNEGPSPYDQIEKYVNGTMSEGERHVFESELSQNTGLKSQVEAYLFTNQLVKEYHLLELKELTAQVHLNEEKKKGWKKTALVATAALLVGSIVFWIAKEKKEEPTPPTASTSRIEAMESPKSAPVLATESEGIKEEKPVLNAQAPSTPSPFKEGSPSPILPEEHKEAVAHPAVIPQKTAAEPGPPSPEVVSPPVLQKEDPCAQIKITANCFTAPACKGEENGTISVSNFKGGKAPYTFTVMDHNKAVHSLLHRIPAGSYEVVLTDAQHCTTTIEDIVVKEKACEQVFSFNPFIGEVWDIPTSPLHGTLTIYEKTGNMYFSRELGAGAQEHWSGQSMEGELKTGYFLFSIHYDNGTRKQGSVSIVR
jgi:hypothetical protein